MIEGGSSNRERAKLAAFAREDWFNQLIDRLVDESVEYLCRQIEAGAEAVQIFDSWAGDLPGETRKLYVERPLAAIVRRLRDRFPNVPAIVFARGVGVDHTGIQVESGAACVGIESELPMSWAFGALGEKCAIQGNLDPVALLGGEGIARREAQELCNAVPMARHVFNLGHGIRPGTASKAVSAVVEAVREYDRSAAAI
jgi:uroporphyrinogen decarboxylase